MTVPLPHFGSGGGFASCHNEKERHFLYHKNGAKSGAYQSENHLKSSRNSIISERERHFL